MNNSSRLQALDGLRAVSILLVLISHAWLGHIVPGGLGVTIFFFISGFIITRLMIREWDKNGVMNIKKFYLRRFFRLLPALLVFVAIALLVMYAAHVEWRWVELFAVFFYFANYFDIFVGFSGTALPSPLGITWSLAVEEHFYMVFPFAFALLIASPKRFLQMITALIVLILLWRLYLVYGVGQEYLARFRIYKATDTRADSILYGSCLALLLARYPGAHSVLNSRWLAAGGSVLLLATLLYRGEDFRESWRYSLQGIALLMMFSTLVLQQGLAARILGSRPMAYIGRVSYSLYLYHWLVLGMITFWLPDWSLPSRMALLLIASFVLSDLSYRLIEQPFQRLGYPYAH
ncbi:acyltransferase family protein [Undibacterium griseum]|uniref:Acyltransferase n=1 Tax=Undibacterium griseum TaxID=2762295 RepID=A0ABR6YQH6_9BURK|nr:acyltransferase [Undibacterium griseum]MBC3886155.1 acyltransferase [Undibacterium griseum]